MTALDPSAPSLDPTVLALAEEAARGADTHALVVVTPRRLTGGRRADAVRPTLQARLTIARYNVNLRLQELEDRLFSARETIDPRTWTATPWVALGVAALIGYSLGHSGTVGRLAALVVRAGVKLGLKRASAHTPAALRIA